MLAPKQATDSHGLETAHRLFAVDGAHLVVGGIPVREIARRFGSPLYIYDAALMRHAFRRLVEALQGFAGIHYSVKANPAPEVIRVFLQEGAGLELASVGEYRAACRAGAEPRRMLYAGPAKGVRELEETIAGGVGEIHLESYEEIERVAAIGRRLGRDIACAVRINPVAAAQAGALRMGGKPTAFGFDEENIVSVLRAVDAAGNIDLAGIHVYAGTQILDAAALLAQWRHAVRLAADVAGRLGRPLRTLDLGGGLGIPYYAGDKPLDLAQVAAAIPSLSCSMRSNPLLRDTRVVVEPGRFLAGPAGLYVAEINAVKYSRGVRFIVTNGGMHHHLAASGNLGQIMKRDYPVVAPAHLDAPALRPATVAGPLCTPLDMLAREALLPELRAGDLVAVLQSGAYGASASPGQFLSHPAVTEVLVENGNAMQL